MRFVIAMLLVPALALGAEEKGAAAPSDDPMAGWVPPKVKNEAKDKQEIQAVFKAMDAAARAGDLDAAAALVDFPVTMMTDDSKGEAKGEAWSKEQWTQVMKPFYAKPMKDMKVTHKPTIFLLSDSLASVDDVCTMTHGGKTMTSRSSTMLVRTDGKWRVKTMAEGGWGDMMASQATAGTSTSGAGSTGTSSGSTDTSGSAGAGSTGASGSTDTSGSSSAGSSGAAGSTGTSSGTSGSTGASPGTKPESDVQTPKQPAPSERTTK